MQQSTGHTAAQASCSWKPTHSVQSCGSMTKMSSPWLIAWFGHSGSHAPQLMHSTVMMVDMAAVSYLRARYRRARSLPRGQEGRLEIREGLLGRPGRRSGSTDLFPLRCGDAHERRPHLGVDLAAGAAGELFAPLRRGPCGPEGAPAGHRLVRLADVEDARGERQLVAREPERVALAVEPLVVGQ